MLTIEDFFITTVSRDDDPGNRPAKLLMSDKKSLHLPTEMSAIHVEQTEYFTEHGASIPSKPMDGSCVGALCKVMDCVLDFSPAMSCKKSVPISCFQ